MGVDFGFSEIRSFNPKVAIWWLKMARWAHQPDPYDSIAWLYYTWAVSDDPIPQLFTTCVTRLVRVLQKSSGH